MRGILGRVAPAVFLAGTLGCVGDSTHELEQGSAVDAPDAIAARGVINANLHPIRENQGCPPPDYANLGASPHTQANAYHVGPGCRFDAAMSFGNFGKPRIISDDAQHTNEQAQAWIEALCAEAAGARGHFHFEHYDFHLDDVAQQGIPIGGRATFPPLARDMIDWLGAGNHSCASALAPNGTLRREGGTNKLAWNGQRVTLIGYGFAGAVAAGDARLDEDAFFDALATHKVNFTRVWAIEQWVGTAVQHQGGRLYDGVTPFAGSFGPGAPSYDLTEPNPRFYARLRRMAQAAADRGVVLQLTLFERHGLTRGPAKWTSSPYNASNNVNGFLEWDEPKSRPHPLFLSDPDVAEVNADYVARVAAEVGGVGNVMFEIFNEARDDDWTTAAISAWQSNTARALNLQLPASVVRDAFNGDADGQLLSGKAADRGGAWTASNARIVAAPGPAGTLGRVVSNENGATAMSGSLPVAAGGSEAIDVRADLERNRGYLVLALVAASGDRVGVTLTPGASTDAAYRGDLELFTRINGVRTVLATRALSYTGPTANVRLRVDLVAGTATVYVNAAPIIEDVPLDSIVVPNRASFYATVDKGAYTADDGAIDNFEIDLYCTDESGC